MRLLRVDANNKVSLTGILRTKIPPYAILSHTWGPEEVDYEDILANAGGNKTGYQKIVFCAQQAARDNIHYFWIDTCCINKANNTELSTALNCMFRWYHDAAKCYVFLDDVPTLDNSWLTNFKKCRWFKRGWTLQELIASQVVEFFAKDGHLLGTKSTLEQEILGITGIPRLALRNVDLSTFTIEQRFSWISSRQTTLEEDRVYSLLGMFGVSMSPLYGEGEKNAKARLKREISALDLEGIENRANLATWLSASAYNHTHETIERTDGTCEWLFAIDDWQKWISCDFASGLWIHGIPGSGKTVLTSAAINKIESSLRVDATFAYFYCDAGDIERHKIEAIIASLCKQLLLNLKQSVPSAVQDLYETERQQGNAKQRPSLEHLCNVLRLLHSCYSTVIYIVDGLDECSENERGPLLSILLAFLQHDAPTSKLFFTSRLTDDLSDRLSHFSQIVVDAAKNTSDIRNFVRSELSQVLTQRKLLNGQVTAELLLEIENTLSRDACGILQIPVLCRATSEKRLRYILTSHPRQLNKQYDRMLSLIQAQESEYTILAMDILRWATFAFRPCKLGELWTIIATKDYNVGLELSDLSTDLALEICHNFIQFEETSDSLTLIHSSARQYLTGQFGYAEGHANLASQCSDYLASCGFDKRTEELIEDYEDPEDLKDIEELPPSYLHNETASEAWFHIQMFLVRHRRFEAFRDTHLFLSYADFPWLTDKHSTVFASWRALNSIEGGLALRALGDLGLLRLKNQTFDEEEPDIVAISAHLGLSNLLLKVLQALPDRKHKHRALVAATCAGMDEIVTNLVSNDDAMSPPGPFMALMQAASSSHTSTVSLLLKALKRRNDGLDSDELSDGLLIATIGACLSPTEAMLEAVYEFSGDRNRHRYPDEMVKIAINISGNTRDGIDERVLKMFDELALLNPGEEWSPLAVASLRGNELSVPILLEGLENAAGEMEFALSLAATLGHVKFVTTLIQSSTTPLPRINGLAGAVCCGEENMVALLTSGVPAQSLFLKAKKDGTQSIVGLAALLGDVSMMRCLVLHGFSLYTEDSTCGTALHYAVLANQKEMVQYLLGELSAEGLKILSTNGKTALDIAKDSEAYEIETLICAALEVAPRKIEKRKRSDESLNFYSSN